MNINKFTSEEQKIVLAAAGKALADADFFDQLTEDLDLTDDAMVGFREELSHLATSPSPELNHVFIEKYPLHLMAAAALTLSDAELFDELVHELNLADDKMASFREKLTAELSAHSNQRAGGDISPG